MLRYHSDSLYNMHLQLQNMNVPWLWILIMPHDAVSIAKRRPRLFNVVINYWLSQL